MKNIIKTLLSVLLVLCLIDLPYGYYQFVRIAATFGFVYLAITEKANKNKNVLYIYIGLALLFQPFMKIVLGRFIWNIVDIVVGFGLIVSVFKTFKITK
jgi:hypothetical protein